MDILTIPVPPCARPAAEAEIAHLNTRPPAEAAEIRSHLAIADVDLNTQRPAAHAHAGFAINLHRTRNTICGRYPISVLLGALSTVERDSLWSGDRTEKDGVKIQFVRYEHSSECESVDDSSVSYASAYVIF